jgi:hypothetical protein
MSLNFDVNSNLYLVRFHTGKIVKMCQFYSDSSRFFFQPAVLYYHVYTKSSKFKKLLDCQN